ncbi:MAG: galactokinase family protein [Candidatus Margulisiibacteriota bacterium]
MTVLLNRAKLSGMFQARFQHAPTAIFRGPSRVNTIGEHVDYSSEFRPGQNDGHAYALPFALPYSVWVSARQAEGRKVRVHSENFGGSFEFDPREMPAVKSANSWENYVLGGFAAAHNEGLPVDGGAEIHIYGDVPIGAGLSSSAGLCVGLDLALDRLFSWNRTKIQIAQLAQGAEHSSYVNVPCGLLDQMASLFGQKDHAMKVDFGNMSEVEQVGLSALTGQGYKFLLINSGVERFLGGTYYGDRKRELVKAGTILSRVFGDERQFVAQFVLKELEEKTMAHFFRNIRMSDMPRALQDKKTPLIAFSDTLYARARYVLAENERTLRFYAALKGSETMEPHMVPSICCGLLNETGLGLSGEGDFNISATVIRNEDGTVKEERPFMDILRGIVTDVINQSKIRGQMQMPFGIRLMGGGGGGNFIVLLPQEYDTPSMRNEIERRYLEAQQNAKYGTSYKTTFIDAEPSDGAGEVLN